MAEDGKGGGFFTLPYDVVVNISQHDKITNRHIAAFLTLCCFSSKNGSTTGAGVAAVQRYCGISRPVAQRLLSDLQRWGFVSPADKPKSATRYKLQTSGKDSLVYLPQTLVTDESIPMKRLAALSKMSLQKVA